MKNINKLKTLITYINQFQLFYDLTSNDLQKNLYYYFQRGYGSLNNIPVFKIMSVNIAGEGVLHVLKLCSKGDNYDTF